jgi:hypothetical protein
MSAAVAVLPPYTQDMLHLRDVNQGKALEGARPVYGRGCETARTLLAEHVHLFQNIYPATCPDVAHAVTSGCVDY